MSRPSPAWTKRRLLTALALVVAGLAGFAMLRLYLVSRDIVDAHRLLEDAGEAVEDGRLADARGLLGRAESLIIDANATLHVAPELQVASLVPVAAQNIEALRATTEVAVRVAARGRALLETAQPLEASDGRLEIPLSGGAVPMDVIGAALVDLSALGVALELPPSIRDPSPFVLPPLRDAQQRMREELEQRRPQVADLHQALTLLHDILGGNGDRRYLIAVANTAEMRGTGGMYLSYGELRSSAGDLELGEFGGIDDLALAAPLDAQALGIPEDELARWEGLRQSELWRNVNLMPDFPAIAPRAATMYQAVTGLPVDGVIQVDPAGLAAILASVGPVEVPGLGAVSSDNVVDVALNTAYTAFPDRDQRQEVLGDVAEAAFQRLVGGEYPSLRPLGTALREAAATRHVMMFSSRPAAREPLSYFEVDGALPPPDAQDYAMLSVQNFAGNKLDYYIETSMVIAGRRPADEPGSITVGVTIANTAPADGEASYVFGPNLPGLAPGQYRSIVSLYVPTGTNLVGASGGTLGEQPVLDTEAGRTVVTYALDLPAGTASAVTLELELPPRADGPYEFTLVPVPRVRPTSVALDVDASSEELVRSAGPLLVVEQIVPDRPA